MKILFFWDVTSLVSKDNMVFVFMVWQLTFEDEDDAVLVKILFFWDVTPRVSKDYIAFVFRVWQLAFEDEGAVCFETSLSWSNHQEGFVYKNCRYSLSPFMLDHPACYSSCPSPTYSASCQYELLAYLPCETTMPATVAVHPTMDTALLSAETEPRDSTIRVEFLH
jgi:hypothetical protein